MGAAVALAFSDPAAIHTEMLQMLPNFLPAEEAPESNVIWWKASMN